jgi:uncharacterized membrane protein YphA (DoxX/SURF4 family)
MALIILATLLGLMATISAFGKLSMNEKAAEMLHHVGLNDRQIRLLGTTEILGSLGLLIGIWIPLLGLLAALGFVVYFLVAVAAHVRAKDGIKDMAPAIVLFVMSLVVAVLQFAR